MITCNEIYRSMRSQGFFDGLEKKGLLVDNRLRLQKIRRVIEFMDREFILLKIGEKRNG